MLVLWALFLITWSLFSYAYYLKLDKYQKNHEYNNKNISNQIAEESCAVKEKINLLSSLIDGLRQDLPMKKHIKSPFVKKSSNQSRSEEFKKAQSEKKKAYWAAKKEREQNSSTPNVITLPQRERSN